MSGISQAVPGLWDGKDSGIGAHYHGILGTYQYPPSSPRTLGWEGQWDLVTLPWDTWEMSGISQVVPGLWDGKDSGIWALYHGTLRMCLEYPKQSRDTGMGRTVGFGHSTMGHSGHVWKYPK